MKTKVIYLVFGFLALSSIVLVVYAQEAAHFADPERVEQCLDNNPRLVREVIEAVCTPKQIADIEAALFPMPTEAEKKVAYERARMALVRSGLDATSPVIVEIDKMLQALVVEPQGL